ncbi:DUF2269 family protein [Paenibacillus sp. J31TS4]|uniref:DUF2269 family protein n=1 Tax=Paenibacillus sp. J31TS4 TaxID=2807195 RepID=UPI001BD0C031|nr:DUF2269 family protein [Paenibacillus sp. J31TS4]
MSLLGLLLVFHILATIAVIGTAFVVPVIRRSARTASQLRFAFRITTKLAILPKIGGAVLLVTGIWLMFITKMGLSQMWLNLSILLSLLMVVTIGGLIEPRMKTIMQIVSESKSQGDEVPAEFTQAMKKIVPLESTAQLLMIAITVLMVVKPF